MDKAKEILVPHGNYYIELVLLLQIEDTWKQPLAEEKNKKDGGPNKIRILKNSMFVDANEQPQLISIP